MRIRLYGSALSQDLSDVTKVKEDAQARLKEAELAHRDAAELVQSCVRAQEDNAANKSARGDKEDDQEVRSEL